MAKTELTLEIEKALRAYDPAEICGIKVNKFRGYTAAFEVPVENGSTRAGLIDCVRINEYFGDIERVRVCRCHRWKREGIRRMATQCPRGYLDSDRAPERCDETGCHWNIYSDLGTSKILISCYEIKVTKSDFKSKNGHNFVGNLNDYVIPQELYSEVADMVPEDIGIILYLHAGSYTGLRRKKPSAFKELTDEEQKWLMLSVLKRKRYGG